MKNISKLFLLAGLFCSFLLVAPVASAQVIGGSTGSAGLLGNTSGGSAFQGSSSQTSPSNISDGSAQANLLQQTPLGNLKVDSPVFISQSAPAAKNQKVWKIFAIIAVIFFVAGITMFTMGYRQKDSGVRVLANEIVPEEVITKDTIAKEAASPFEKPEPKKPKKKKQNTSKVKRRKKKH